MTDAFLPLIVSSPSGAGKTTLLKRLLSRHPDMVQSVSCTTRAPREGEVDGRDYCFIDEERFGDMIRRDAFAEWAEVHGNRYGTSIERIDAARKQHGGMVFVIDVQGARQLKARIADAVAVFVLPPSLSVLESRLRGRGSESDASLERRMKNAVGELSHYAGFDYVVVNDDLDAASREMEAIVLAERSRRWRRARLVEQVLRGETVTAER
ncbi:MAG: guanylate kinase [Polyangiales bacterium]